MNNRETKKMLRETIHQYCDENDVYYRDVDSIRILTRCPFCGDSDNQKHAHFYIICDPDVNNNAGYKCFKCGESGPFTDETLSAFGINDPNLKSGIITLNKTASKIDKKRYMEETTIRHFDYQIPSIYRGNKVAYLEKRLGRTFSDEELRRCKVITSLHRFLDANQIHSYTVDKYMLNLLERDYIGFLSYGNSHILFRDITEKNHCSWFKYRISDESSGNQVFYSVATEIDPLTPEPITINLAEGIMDVLSACFNLGYDKENTLNVCVSGNHYEKFLLFLLDLGFVGSNVTINIFADNDAVFNPKAKKQTDESYFRRIFSRMSYLYKEVNVYWNIKKKDIGYPREDIRLKKIRI